MPKYSTLDSVQKDLLDGSISCTELVNYYLSNIENNHSLNVYIEVYKEEILDQAKALDDRIKSDPKNLGRLFGMVISIKDVLCYEGHEVTGGSKILSGFKSLYTATAIQRLLVEDVLIIGRVNCDEFAMGSANENSFYGPTKNGIGEHKVPGGSSGASAVSVQIDSCLAAIGSDTGGSVRQPAAFCGVVGMKPSYGRISRYGLLAYASSFDQIGTLSNSVGDAAILLEVMAGPDDFDSTCSPEDVQQYSALNGFSGKAKIAYFENTIKNERIDKKIKTDSYALIEKLKSDGHQMDALEFELLDYLIPAYYVLTTAEASSNLSRYDGIRYGYRSEQVSSLTETYRKSRTEGFGDEVKRRIMLGTFVLSSGYYDAYYTKAQQVRRMIYNYIQKVFEEYDFILMPVTPDVAWDIGTHENDPVKAYLADIYTVLANMAGIPAISIPLGTKNGMPFGIQVLSPLFQEDRLLSFVNSHIK